jgi:hypothetical protein
MPLKVMQAIGDNESIAGNEDGLIEVKEEVKPTQVEALATDLSLEEMEIQNGDILIFQLRTPQAINRLQKKIQQQPNPNPKKMTPPPAVPKAHCEIREYYKHWLRKSKLAQAKGTFY